MFLTHLGHEGGDDLCLAFALGVGTPWRHRSLIPGIVMLHRTYAWCAPCNRGSRLGLASCVTCCHGPKHNALPINSPPLLFTACKILSRTSLLLFALRVFRFIAGCLHIVPSVNLFRVFYKIGKQGDWFTFEKRVGPGSGGKILNETFSSLKGWKKRFFFLDQRAIPQAMAWRHHDSDIHDPLPTDGFHASDVVTLTNQSIDIRPVPSGLLFHAGLATTWEFSGFLPVFKDTEGNVVTMSEYLRFPFLDGATIEQGDALSARDAITQRTTGPLPVNQSLPEKTARLKEVEISDPKIVAIRERKARAAAKNFDESGGHGETIETHPADETRLTETPVPARNPKKTAVQDLILVVRSNLAGDHADGAESSRPGQWHQLYALLRFEALYDAHLALKERCEDVTRQLVSTQTDFTHVSNLYNTFSNRYQQVRGEHVGCAEKLIDAERERDELRAVNADQASHIKEFEAELARKDSALVFSDRVSNERAVENERLMSNLGYLEKEKTDSIGKLLPTVVRRLLNSHEYKESLSIPFNLAIQAGWANKLFTKTYPFVEKISGLPRRTVQEFLKMYPAPPPQDAPTKVNPSSQAHDSSKSMPPRG
ncbi:hypothetical protein Tco_0420987 [Tanacetum coccineum]